MNPETREWADWVPCSTRSFMVVKSDLKNEEMQIICAWGGWLSGRCEGFLYHLQSGECADRVQILLRFKVSQQAVEKWFEMPSRLHTFYFRLKLHLKWNLKYIDSFSAIGTRGLLKMTSHLRPEFVHVGVNFHPPVHPALFTHNTGRPLLFLSCSLSASRSWPETGSMQVFPHDILWAQCPACCDSERVIYYHHVLAVLVCFFKKNCLNNLHILW